MLKLFFVFLFVWAWVWMKSSFVNNWMKNSLALADDVESMVFKQMVVSQGGG